VDPLGGTQYGMYATNWMYGTCLSVLDILTWPSGGIPGLRLIDGDVGLLSGVKCDIVSQGLIGLI
jgi:hypothetical protein